MPWAPEANEFGVRTKRFVLSHPRIGIKNARVQRFATGGVRGRRPWAASSGSVPHRVASAGRGEASLDIVLGDDRSRAGRTGPKGEDFGDHGGSRIGVSFGTVLEAVVAACLRRKASEAVREGALAG